MRLTAARGVTLVELLVAMAMASVIAGTAFAGLIQAGRVTDRIVRREGEERLAAEVVAVLEALGQHLRYPVILGDTALHGDLRIGVGVACHGAPSATTLAPTVPGALAAMTLIADAPLPGDQLSVYVTSSDGVDTATWESVRVLDVTMPSALEGCGPTSAFVPVLDRGTGVLRLSHGQSLGGPASGAPVELYREVRVVVYHAGTSGWMVGLRSCVDARCGPAQPIVGPVRSPRDSGLRFMLTDRREPITIAVRVPGSATLHSGVIPALGARF
ncbi:MAG: hypothetical protein RL625_1651 [Gemmatimonadota bacterium]|jgi:prepilin-type N-terminal cleavage/methylation domain-containing protein